MADIYTTIFTVVSVATCVLANFTVGTFSTLSVTTFTYTVVTVAICFTCHPYTTAMHSIGMVGETLPFIL